MTRYISSLSLVLLLAGFLLLFLGHRAIRALLQNDEYGIQKQEEEQEDVLKLRYSLVEASAVGNLERVKRLIEDKELSANIVDPIGRSPLRASLESGHIAITNYLLKHGATVNDIDLEGNSALMLSVRYNRVEPFLQLLEKGAELNHRSPIGRTALYEAALSGNYMMVDKLLAAGADVNGLDIFGNTIIHAAVLSKNVPVLRKVIATLVDLDIKNKSGITPLGLAVSHQLVPQVRVLLENTATVWLKDIDGENILTQAVRSDELRKDIQMKEVNKVISLSQQRVADEMDDIKLQDLKRTQVIVALLLAGNDNKAELVNSRDKESRTPLMYAVLNGNFLVVEQLIKAGANINMQDAAGMSALHLATQAGYTVIIEDLLAAGADLDIRNKQGRTPVQLAQDLGLREVEKTLTRQAQEAQ